MLIAVFFVYSSGAHPALHSFPTRRSSDLSVLAEDEADLGAAVLDLGAGTTTIAVFAEGRFVHADGFAVGGLHVTIDRKSTRLNSSHANISYAVFCLKKKKKQ